MARHDSPRKPSLALGSTRTGIAAAAARLMAEDGITDYQQAKKKALRQLGLPEHTALPDNSEIDDELRAYRALYQAVEHPAILAAMRRSALQLMEFLAAFRPYLTGSVLDGTAGEYSQIDLLLFADSAKEVEIFLLNHGIDVQHATSHHDKVDAVLQIATDSVDAAIATFQKVVDLKGPLRFLARRRLAPLPTLAPGHQERQQAKGGHQQPPFYPGEPGHDSIPSWALRHWR